MKRHVASLLLLVAFLWVVRQMMADPGRAQEPTASAFRAPETPGFPEAGGIVPWVLLLAVLAAGGLYVAKNGLPMRATRRTASRKLQISEMRSLGGRQFLVVVEYEDSRMLLGVAPGKIDYLCPLDARAGGSSDFAALVAGAGGQESEK